MDQGPGGPGGGGDPESASDASLEEPGLWDKLLDFFGMGPEEEPQEEPEPYRLPTAEELLGLMCESFGIQGENAVDEKAAEAAGEEVPTLNIGTCRRPTPARWRGAL